MADQAERSAPSPRSFSPSAFPLSHENAAILSLSDLLVEVFPPWAHQPSLVPSPLQLAQSFPLHPLYYALLSDRDVWGNGANRGSSWPDLFRLCSYPLFGCFAHTIRSSLAVRFIDSFRSPSEPPRPKTPMGRPLPPAMQRAASASRHVGFLIFR